MCKFPQLTGLSDCWHHFFNIFSVFYNSNGNFLRDILMASEHWLENNNKVLKIIPSSC